MEKKNRTLLYVVGVLLVIGVGISLAYFAAAILSSGNGSVTNVKTANIGDTTIVTEGNVEFSETDIYPGHKTISKIKITATGNQAVIYNLIWKGVNTLQTSLNYTVYKSTTNETPSVTCEKKEQGNITKILYEECTSSGFNNLEELTTGVIATSTEETIFKLKENESITASIEGTEVYYYVVLEFPNEQSSQNFDANGRFEGETNIEVPGIAEPSMTVNDIIAKLDVKTGTPDFSVAAIGAEYEDNNGIFVTDDPIYTTTENPNSKTYYWRGAATTNHVIFADKCWRIVRINGDGTMRLIYNGSVLTENKCTGNGSYAGSIAVTGKAYNPSSDRSEYVGYTYSTGSQRTTEGTASNLKTQTGDWYNTNIGNNTIYASKVADGKFCNDRNTGSEYSWSSQPSSTFYYAGYDRSGAKNANTVNPTLACSTGDVYTLKAGVITMDEVVMAGGEYGTGNSSYYLYNGQHYWTMSPYWWSGSRAGAFFVHTDGHIGSNWLETTYGLRPVINIVSDVTFELGGLGTSDSPYIVEV